MQIRSVYQASAVLLAVLCASFANAQSSQPTPPPGASALEYTAPPPPRGTSLSTAQPAAASASPAAGQYAPHNPANGLPKDVFDQVVGDTLPFSPKQVKELKQKENDVVKAHAARPTRMPKPSSGTRSISLSAGKAPEIIRLAADFTTTLVFTDSSGAAWPVQRVIVGNKLAVTVPELEGAEGAGGALPAPTSIISLVPMIDYVNTNMTVLLQGAPAPITFVIVSNQPSMDMRLDYVVQGRGPNSPEPTFESAIGNTKLPLEFSQLLDGVAPKDAVRLKVDSPLADAWLWGGRMLVRSRFTVISPQVFQRGMAADGTGVYGTVKTSEIRLMHNGKVELVRVSGFPSPVAEAARKQIAGQM